MTRYRRQAAEVDAIPFDGTHASVVAVMRFVDAGRDTTEISIHADKDPTKTHITIPTRSGNKVRLSAGFWIIRDNDGALSACRHDLFRETYGLIDATPATPPEVTPRA